MQQSFTDMENMFDLLDIEPEVSSMHLVRRRKSLSCNYFQAVCMCACIAKLWAFVSAYIVLYLLCNAFVAYQFTLSQVTCQ